MLTAITVLQVISCIILVGFVLLQPAKSSGSAFGPSEQSLTGNSAGTSAPFKLTMMAAAFLCLSSLYVGWSRVNDSKSSVIDDLEMPISSDIAPSMPSTMPSTEKSEAVKTKETSEPK